MDKRSFSTERRLAGTAVEGVSFISVHERRLRVFIAGDVLMLSKEVAVANCWTLRSVVAPSMTEEQIDAASDSLILELSAIGKSMHRSRSSFISAG
jgi:hypothetical protein